MNKYFSIKGIKRYNLSKRLSKVNIKQFGRAGGRRGNISFKDFVKNLPDILSAKDIVSLAEAIIRCKKKGKTIILMMGAHPVKCGLNEYLIVLLKQGFITYIATNGATLIHDFEIAYGGRTSEDVEMAIEKGQFGLAYETGKFINDAINTGAEKGWGMGESIGYYIKEHRLKYRKYSLFYNAYKLKRFITCHIAIGTDIIHQHPETQADKLGITSYNDFLRFTNRLTELEGGIIINLGSAVIMPEVFLKSLNLVRNKRYRIRNFTSVNMDMTIHYRPLQNVLKRPTKGYGKSINIIGRHEINIPLLYQIIQVLK